MTKPIVAVVLFRLRQLLRRYEREMDRVGEQYLALQAQAAGRRPSTLPRKHIDLGPTHRVAR